MAKLVLVRHGQSEYNKQGIWTGWDDPGLTELGFEQARKAGQAIKDIHFDLAYTSDLKRAQQTLEQILEVLGQTDIKVIVAWETKERSYGIYTKKNKWQVKQEQGEEEFQKIRRSWDFRPANGESLADVNQRFWKFYQSEILLKLKKGQNLLISSSGNAFRGLIKSLENLTEEQIAKVEFGIGEVWIYEIEQDGRIVNKEIRNKNPLSGKQ